MVKMFQLEIDAFSASTVQSICYYENVLEFCDDGERCETFKVFVGSNLNDAAFPIRHTIAALTHYSRTIDTNKQLKMVTRMVASLNAVLIRLQCVPHFLAFAVTFGR